MEKNPRFSPLRDTQQSVQLAKEIYRREEKVLGLSPPPEKERFEKFIREIKPKFSGTVEPYYRSQYHEKSESIENPSPFYQGVSGSAQNLGNLNLNQKIKANQEILPPTNRNWQIPPRPINGAGVFKDRYDYNNRSPITWLAKRELMMNSRSERKYSGSTLPISEFSRLGKQLNPKKVLKGMGYAKSNIFTN